MSRKTCESCRLGAKPAQKNSLSLMRGPPTSTPTSSAKSGLRRLPTAPPTRVTVLGSPAKVGGPVPEHAAVELVRARFEDGVDDAAHRAAVLCGVTAAVDVDLLEKLER